MAHQVFISYSSKDKPIADAICANLEAATFRCWVAPRDIGPGDDWPTAIAKAISESRVMVLVFSANANASEEISRELYIAANHQVIIIPFRIEDCKPEAGKEYYLGRTHWLDAMNPPTREQLRMLIDRVRSLLPTLEPSGIVERAPAAPAPTPVSAPARSRKEIWIVSALAALVLVVIASSLFVLMTGAPVATPTSVALASTVQPTSVQAAPVNSTLPPATRAPQASTPVPTATPSKFLYEEHFSNPNNDGQLPLPILAECPTANVAQKDGALVIALPANVSPTCKLNFGNQFQLSDVLYVEARVKVSAYTGPKSPELVYSLGFAGTGAVANAGCGLGPTGITCVGIRLGGTAVFTTPPMPIQHDSWHTVRIELADPQTLEFKLYRDGTQVGSFAMPKEDVDKLKMQPLTLFGGIEGSGNTSQAFTAYVEDVIVMRRIVGQAPVAAVNLLYEEHFDDPKNEGKLPSTLRQSCDKSGVTLAQQNGALQYSIAANVEASCGWNGVLPYKPAEFRAFEARVKLAPYAGGAPPRISLTESYSNPKINGTPLRVGCKAAVGQLNCMVGGETPEWTAYYDSKPVKLDPDVWYSIRMELANQETQTYRFYLDGKEIGSYILTNAQIAQVKDDSIVVNIDVVTSSPTQSAFRAWVDDILVLGQ